MQIRTGEVESISAAALDGRTSRLRSSACRCPADAMRIRCGDAIVLDEARVDLHRAWSSTTHAMQRLRDNPARGGSGVRAHCRMTAIRDWRRHLTFDPHGDLAAPYIARGARPRVAILREQGVNGHVEMAAAFTRAGFDAFDVHMSDLAARPSLARRFSGLRRGRRIFLRRRAGRGRGVGEVDPVQRASCATSSRAFFDRGDTFALGVCNGCQMMSNLHEIIPGTAHWPHFVRNASEQFEARFVMLEVLRIAVAVLRRHGRQPHSGRAGARRRLCRVSRRRATGRRAIAGRRCASSIIAACATETYPYNPNGSPQGITGLTTADGRFTILMPHPERVWRTAQMSWHPDRLGRAVAVVCGCSRTRAAGSAEMRG